MQHVGGGPVGGGRGWATGVRRVRTALCSTLVRVRSVAGEGGDRGEEGAYRVVQHVGEGPEVTGVRRVRTALCSTLVRVRSVAGEGGRPG